MLNMIIYLIVFAIASDVALAKPRALPDGATPHNTSAVSEGTNRQCQKPGYNYYASVGKCYKLHKKPSTWEDSARACAAEGTHLVVIANANEAQIIKNMFRLVEYRWMFIGLHQTAELGNWQGVNGQPVAELYNVWRNAAQPPADERWLCGTMNENGLLDDFICTWHKPFVCQEPAV